MGTLLLLQIGMDLAFIAVVTVLLIERTKLRGHEDPRLSRGLQLLTSKIAILQDLMDRSESSSKQLTQLLEVKQQDVHETLEEVDRHLHKVQESMEKSKSVARLFQDRIPHEEVIERQTSAKYIKAAKLAHQGLSVDEIANQIDIPRGELDLIVKLNKHELISRDESVWLGEEDAGFTSPGQSFSEFSQSETANELEEEHSVEQVMAVEPPIAVSTPVPTVAAPVSRTLIYSSHKRGATISEDSQEVRPVIFRKIESEPKY